MAACATCTAKLILLFSVRGGVLAALTPLLLSVLNSCSADSSRFADQQFTVRSWDSAGVKVFEFSHTLDELPNPEFKIPTLRSDYSVGGGDVSFGAIADVASLGAGRFAVFDRAESKIVLFDSAGTRVSTYGREGDGPGEFRYPWALTAIGKNLVAWQARPTSTFTILDPGGTVLATGSRPVDGDWTAPMYRRPLLRLEGVQRGPEDVTRRISALGDTGFVVYLQPNEYANIDDPSPPRSKSPQAYLLRFGLDAKLRDTMAVLAAPPSLLEARLPGLTVIYRQPLFVGRPAWAIGKDWLALGHGDSSQIVVRRFTGEKVAVVRFPGRRAAVSREDRLEAAKWILAIRILNSRESRSMYEAASGREVKQAVEGTAFDLTPFAEVSPNVTALYAVGSCVFLGGYSPRDYADGTSLTWGYVNVQNPGTAGAFRIPPPEGEPLEFGRKGRAVREFDDGFVYTVHRDHDGVALVERFRLPPLAC